MTTRGNHKGENGKDGNNNGKKNAKSSNKRGASNGSTRLSKKPKADQDATAAGPVALDFDIHLKPVARGDLNKAHLLALVEDRGLLNREWNEGDHHAIANILVGRSLDINLNDENDGPLTMLAHRIGEEYERSAYFLRLMEPPWIIFHSLPMQGANGAAVPMNLNDNVQLHYNTWPASNRAAVSAPFLAGMLAAADNVPIQWKTVANDGILDNANRTILCKAGNPHRNIGQANSALTFPFSGNPFIVACRSHAERVLLAALLMQDMDKRFPAGRTGFSYSFVNSTVTINYSV